MAGGRSWPRRRVRAGGWLRAFAQPLEAPWERHVSPRWPRRLPPSFRSLGVRFPGEKGLDGPGPGPGPGLGFGSSPPPHAWAPPGSPPQPRQFATSRADLSLLADTASSTSPSETALSLLGHQLVVTPRPHFLTGSEDAGVGAVVGLPRGHAPRSRPGVCLRGADRRGLFSPKCRVQPQAGSGATSCLHVWPQNCWCDHRAS